MNTTRLLRSVRACALVAGLSVLPSALHAQSQFAGTYIGTINTKVTVPVVGSIESAAGGYIATVTAAGAVDVSGVLTGTKRVAASASEWRNNPLAGARGYRRFVSYRSTQTAPLFFRRAKKHPRPPDRRRPPYFPPPSAFICFSRKSCGNIIRQPSGAR